MSGFLTAAEAAECRRILGIALREEREIDRAIATDRADELHEQTRI